MPNLIFLKVKVNAQELEIEDEKLPWRDDYTDLDLIRIPEVAALLKLRGLKKIVVEESNPFTNRNSETGKRMDRLCKQVEQLLSDVTARPREPMGNSENINSVIDLLAAGFRRDSSPAKLQEVEPHNTSRDRLTTDDMPHTEADFARLFFLRPHALYDWVKDAMERLGGKS